MAKLIIYLKEFWQRLNSIQPWGGAITRRKPERDVVNTLIRNLEDRRLLFDPDCQLANPKDRQEMIDSCEEMRRNIKAALGEIAPRAPSTTFLVEMRDACHSFQNFFKSDSNFENTFESNMNRREAITNLQKIMGLNIGELSERFDIPIDGKLKTNIPRGILRLGD
jgi:hypothetical protein